MPERLCAECGKSRTVCWHDSSHPFCPADLAPSDLRSWNGRELRHLTRNCADGDHAHCGGVAKFANADNTDDCRACNCSCHNDQAPSEPRRGWCPEWEGVGDEEDMKRHVSEPKVSELTQQTRDKQQPPLTLEEAPNGLETGDAFVVGHET